MMQVHQSLISLERFGILAIIRTVRSDLGRRDASMQIAAHRAMRTIARSLIVALFLLAFGRAGQGNAQAIIKVNDDVNFKVGVLLQTQADFQEVANSTANGSGGYQENLFVRRVRLIVGGQVAKNVFFFLETENPSLGKSTQAVGATTGTKALGSGFIILDAAAEWRIAKEFNIQFGEIRAPISREGLKSTPTQFMFEQSAYNFPTSAALQGNSERDTGGMLRGYFLSDHLEYRGAVLAGFRAPGVKNAPRFTGRLQYDVLDTEVYNFVSYPGSYLGTKKILALGGGYDTQSDYKYYSADMYLDLPIPLGSVESTVEYQHIDGGTTFATALPEQNLFQVEGGVFLKALQLAPIFRYEQKEFKATVNEPRNEHRVAVGLNFYPFPKTPHALNIKCWWQRVTPKVGFATNQFTVQMQIYYF
jgi:hypothetical protein